MRVNSVCRGVVAAVLGVLVFGGSSAQAALTAPQNGGVYRGDVPFNEDAGGRSRSLLTPADTAGGPASLDTQPELDASAGYITPAIPPFIPAPIPGGCLSKSSSASNAANPLRTLPAADTTAQSYVQITRNADTAQVMRADHFSNQTLIILQTTPPTPQAWENQPYGGTWLTAGAQAGMYTARSYKRDIVRGDPNAPVLVTDTATQKANKRNAISTCRINTGTTANDALVSTVQFEYRPWEQRFKDTLNNAGGVDFNINSSREFQFSLRDGRQSTIKDAPQSFTVIKMPTDAGLVLPPDPSVCLADPAVCTPTTPQQCASAPASCSDRLVIINYTGDKAPNGDTQQLFGLFDLDSRAFVSYVRMGNTVVILKSLGQVDAQVLALKQQLIIEAAKLGINGAQLSAMQLSYVGGGTTTKLSLDEALEFLTQTGRPNGATIIGGPAVEAGVVIHLIIGTYKGLPLSTTGPYSIYGSALTLPPLTGLPALPALPAPLDTYGPLVDGLLAAGGIGVRQIKAAGYTGGSHIYALAAGLEPATQKLLYIPTDAATISDKSIDFVGVPLVVINGGACNALGQCAGLGVLTGAGVALYDSPVTIPPLLP
jgi:hypothetical protein